LLGGFAIRLLIKTDGIANPINAEIGISFIITKLIPINFLFFLVPEINLIEQYQQSQFQRQA
jgi:hypothetical protein